jgi:hypothetical protein
LELLPTSTPTSRDVVRERSAQRVKLNPHRLIPSHSEAIVTTPATTVSACLTALGPGATTSFGSRLSSPLLALKQS